MDLFKSATVLSSEQTTVLPYLIFRFSQNGMHACRLDQPVHGNPSLSVGGIADKIAEMPCDDRPVFLEEPHPRLQRFQMSASNPIIGS